MVYFRELPQSPGEYSEDALDFFFEFANTYTEKSILDGYTRQRKDEEGRLDADTMRALGYSEKDILDMNL